jgi:hypothetical protein
LRGRPSRCSRGPRPARTDGFEPDPLVDFARLQSMTRVGPLVRMRVALNNVRSDEHTLLGFLPLQRFRNRAATGTGIASPGYAASSDFFSPLTPCSARDPAGLVSYRLRSWGFPFRGLSLPGAGMPFGVLAPPGVVVDGRTRRSSKSGPATRHRGGRSAPKSGGAVAQGRGRGRTRLQGFRARPGSPYSGQRVLAA